MKRVIRAIIPLSIVVLGVLIAVIMVKLGGHAQREPVQASPTPVSVMAAQHSDGPAHVQTTGVVQADRQIVIIPQVSGRITWQSEAMVPGGRLRQGEALARVDPRDYELALDQQRSLVQKAQLDLEIEQSRQATAAHEWRVLGDDREDAALALRRPHLEVARLALESAQSALERAQLNLDRTTLRAPFNAVVLSEAIDVGQTVGPSSQVATLVGTDRVRVQISLPVDQLRFIQIPGLNATEGSRVVVRQDIGGGQQVVREGRVDHLEGQLDPQTRTAQVLVTVEDPYGDGELPLLPGAYVDVDILGTPLADLIVVPRAALYDGQTVWTVEGDDEPLLHANTVQVAFRDAESIYVSDGLPPDARVVTSPLALPLEGTPVRVDAIPGGDAAPTGGE